LGGGTGPFGYALDQSNRVIIDKIMTVMRIDCKLLLQLTSFRTAIGTAAAFLKASLK